MSRFCLKTAIPESAQAKFATKKEFQRAKKGAANAEKAIRGLMKDYGLSFNTASGIIKSAVLKNPRFGVTNQMDSDIAMAKFADLGDLRHDDDVLHYVRMNGYERAKQVFDGKVKFFTKNAKRFERLQKKAQELFDKGFIDKDGFIVRELDAEAREIIEDNFIIPAYPMQNLYAEIVNETEKDGKIITETRARIILPALKTRRTEETGKTAEQTGEESIDTAMDIVEGEVDVDAEPVDAATQEQIEDIETRIANIKNNSDLTEDEKAIAIAGILEQARSAHIYAESDYNSAVMHELSQLDARDLSELATSMSKMLCSILRRFSEDSALCRSAGIDENLTLEQIISDRDVVARAVDMLHNYLLNVKESPYFSHLDKNAQRAITVGTENFGALMNISNEGLWGLLHMRINPDATVYEVQEAEINDSTLEDGSVDTSVEEEQMDEKDDQANPVGHTVSEEDKSVLSKIDNLVKFVLSTTASDIDATNRFGLTDFIDVPQSINFLLALTADCLDEHTFLAKLRTYSGSRKWVSSIVHAIDPNLNQGANARQAERLLHAFYKSFRKEYHNYDLTYTYRDEDGTLLFARKDLSNQGRTKTDMPIVKRSMAEGKVPFIGKTANGQFVFTGGQPNSQFRRLQELGTRIIIDVGNQTAEGSYSFDYAVERIAPMIKELFNALGIRMTDEEAQVLSLLDVSENVRPANQIPLLTSILLNAIGTKGYTGVLSFFTTREEKIREIWRKLDDARLLDKQGYLIKDAPKETVDEITKGWNIFDKNGRISLGFRTNPIDEDIKGFIPLSVVYKRLLDSVYKYLPSSRESMIYCLGKAHYCWNNPSTIQTLVSRLKGVGKTKDAPGGDVTKYLKDKYGRDKWFFYDTDLDTGMPIFHSRWLREISTSSEARKDLEYSSKLSFDDTKYLLTSDLQYAMSELIEYQNGGTNDLAWYRMPISSNKNDWGHIRYKKYTVDGRLAKDDPNYMKLSQEQRDSMDFRTVALMDAVLGGSGTKAKSSYLYQEIYRIRRTINNAVARYKDGLSTAIKNYDIKRGDIEAIVTKLDNGETITPEDLTKEADLSIYSERGLTELKPSKRTYLFENTGADFYFCPFIRKEIENNTELGQKIVEIIFNDKVDFSVNDYNALQDAFFAYMDNMVHDMYLAYKKAGAFDIKLTKDGVYSNTNIAGILRKNHTNIFEEGLAVQQNVKDYMLEYEDEKDEPGLFLLRHREKNLFMHDVEEFVYNNYLAKINMLQMFNLDPAFYGGTVKFQKYNAEIVSSGNIYNEHVTIDGKPLTDGNFRAVTITGLLVDSETAPLVEMTLKDYASELMKDKATSLEGLMLQKQIPAIMSHYRNAVKKPAGAVDVTDGQGYTSLTGARKKKASLGEWSMSKTAEMDLDTTNPVFTDEAVYQRFRSGKPLIRDFQHVFGQAFKNFTYSWETIERVGENGQSETISVPVHYKSSEYILANIMAFVAARQPQSPLAGLNKFMEETADKTNGIAGVDSIFFDSAAKVADRASINVNGLDGQGVYDALMAACVRTNKNGNIEYTEYVHTHAISDTKQQQQIPEDFIKHKQKQGSQEKIIIVNGIDDASQIPVNYGNGHIETISGEKLKKEYFTTLAQKADLANMALARKFGITNPDPLNRKKVLSNMLSESASLNSKYSVDTKWALSIYEGDFVLSLDDFTLANTVEAMILSAIRKEYYNQGINGGPIVQTTSWGWDRNYHIRYYDKDAPFDESKILKTKSEFEANRDLIEKYGDYNSYAKARKGAIAYYEGAVPMPKQIRDQLLNPYTGEIDQQYIKSDGTYDMIAIKKKIGNPEAFDAIGYRIPSEAKYSCFNLKIVDFIPDAGGSAIILPQEITAITGADFDIDKMFIMLRALKPVYDRNTKSVRLATIDENTKNARREDVLNNKLFRLEQAAWSAKDSTVEVSSPGDFSDLSARSKRMYLSKSGMFKQEALDKMSDDAIAELCERKENLDLLSPVTDILLHRQNGQASEIIGMAAVSNITHMMIALHNNTNKANEIRFKADIALNFEEDNPSLLVKGLSPRAISIGKRNVVDPALDTYGRSIALQLCKYIGSSADAGKDAALYRLGISPHSFPVVEFLIRNGVSSETAEMFINQPVIRRVFELYETETLGGKTPMFSRIIDEVERELVPQMPLMTEDELIASGLMRRYGSYNAYRSAVYAQQANIRNLIDEQKRANNHSFKYSTLSETLNNDISEEALLQDIISNQGQNIKEMANQLEALRDALAYEDLMRNMGTWLRYNSSNAAHQSSMAAYTAKRRSVERLLQKGGDAKFSAFENLYDAAGSIAFISTFPYIHKIIEGQAHFVNKIIREEMPSWGEDFNAILDMVEAQSPRYLSEDDINTIHQDYKLMLMTRGYEYRDENGERVYVPPVVDFNSKKTLTIGNNANTFKFDSAREFYETKFASYYEAVREYLSKHNPEQFKKYIENNSFLNGIDSVIDEDGNGYLRTDVNGISEPERQKLKDDWTDMLNSTSPEVRTLAVEMAKYFIFRGAGLKYSPSTPTHLIPTKIKLAMPRYAESLRRKEYYVLSPTEQFMFVYQLYRNHPDANFVTQVPYVSRWDEGLRQRVREPWTPDMLFKGFDIMNQTSGELTIREELSAEDRHRLLSNIAVRYNSVSDSYVLPKFITLNGGLMLGLCIYDESEAVPSGYELMRPNVVESNGRVFSYSANPQSPIKLHFWVDVQLGQKNRFLQYGSDLEFQAEANAGFAALQESGATGSDAHPEAGMQPADPSDGTNEKIYLETKPTLIDPVTGRALLDITWTASANNIHLKKEEIGGVLKQVFDKYNNKFGPGHDDYGVDVVLYLLKGGVIDADYPHARELKEAFETGIDAKDLKQMFNEIYNKVYQITKDIC